MHHDSFFSKGSKHLVCEDYAQCLPTFGVVSDGCSSVANSDLGSRFLALAALKHRKKLETDFSEAQATEFYDLVVKDALYSADYLNILYTALHATLGVLVPVDNYFKALLCGDCFAVARRRAGGLKIVELDYNNMPYYPLYSLLGEDTLNLEEMSPSIRITEVLGDGAIQVASSKNPFKKFFLFDFPRSEFDLVAVTTDGLAKFAGQGDFSQKIEVAKVATEIFGKAKADDSGRFFGVKALEDGLNRLVNLYDKVLFGDDFSFAMFLDS